MSGEGELYRCCGCGALSAGGIKPCECPTGLGYRRNAGDYVRFVTIEEYDAAELAHLIRTRLMGVLPEDQDLQLEDHDWQRIVNALEPTP